MVLNAIVFTSRKSIKTFFFHLKVSKANATIHINLYFVNFKKQINENKVLQPLGPIHNLWSTADIIM